MLLTVEGAPCACFSFCTLHDATHALRLVPDALHPASPWEHYLRGVYGERWVARYGEPLDELRRLQLVYTRGIPATRCAPASGSRVARATIPILPRRVDEFCPFAHCVRTGWYPPNGTRVGSRPALRGIEPYFVAARGGAFETAEQELTGAKPPHISVQFI